MEHKVYLLDEQYNNSLNPRISSQVSNLRTAINNQDHAETLKSLVDCLYTVRNARVHGSFGTGRTSFVFLPKAIYLLNVSILCSKLAIDHGILENEIDRRLVELKKERQA